ncbi:MAG TPA: hypothetical protein VN522_09095 [Solirubrobacterales bacterium]|nr:hypothetical protein [Solirubrobacterales bacterium]
MLRRVLSGAVVLALAVVGSGSSTAVAAESSPAPGGVFLLNGTNGYRLGAVFGARGGNGAMELLVVKSGETAFYKAEGIVAGSRIDIDLGLLGKFDLERRLTGKTETIHGCGHSEAVPGYEFVGTIEFHGEEGFTEVIATRADMDWTAVIGAECHLSGGGEVFGDGIPGVRIKVRDKQGPALQLNQNHHGAKVTYSAEVAEREGAVSVHRFVSGRLGAGALSFTPSLGSATFTGAGPFAGEATYVEAQPPRGTHPGQGAWRGNLTVDFPGASDVGLAGPGFKAGIIHARRTEWQQ